MNNYSNLEKIIKDFLESLGKNNIIFFASYNDKKIHEALVIAAEKRYVLVTPRDFGIKNDPEEIGTSYEENAMIKASESAKIIRKLYPNIIVVAEDSGFCIDAWNQAPGLYSHRYIIETANGCETTNVKNILKKMENEPNRKAHYVCCMAVIMPDDEKFFTVGELPGELTYAPRGEYSTGYDTMLLVGDKTVAEMNMHEKNKISHRGIALRKAIEEIEKRKNKLSF